MSYRHMLLKSKQMREKSSSRKKVEGKPHNGEGDGSVKGQKKEWIDPIASGWSDLTKN
jgi:hypothetical protein